MSETLKVKLAKYVISKERYPNIPRYLDGEILLERCEENGVVKGWITITPANLANIVAMRDNPTLRPDIEKRVRELGLENKVVITGFIPNSQIPKILEGASVFVLPSYSEGLSNALLQAMAAGLPCIVSDIEENREVIHRGVNGLLFPVGDSKALAETLIQVLTDKELASKLGLMARESVKHLKLKNFVKLYLKSFLHSIRQDEGRTW